MDKREEVIRKIVEIELDMFTKVKTAEPAPCQQQLKTFKLMRQMSHFVLATDTLESYLEDLIKAQAAGRNLVTEKYARMDNLIPPINTNPIIDDIVRIESAWMKELHEKYPNAIKIKGGFSNYAASELETYSNRTLKYYYRDVFTALQEGENLAEKRYIYLYQALGYKSLEEVEHHAKTKVN